MSVAANVSDRSSERVAVPAAWGAPPDRWSALLPLAGRLTARLGVLDPEPPIPGPRAVEGVVPHQALRRALQADAAVAALLPWTPLRVALGDRFRLTGSGLLTLPPALLGAPATLAAATRWALETADLLGVGTAPRPPVPRRAAIAALSAHGAALAAGLAPAGRALLAADLRPASPSGGEAGPDHATADGFSEALLGLSRELAADPRGGTEPERDAQLRVEVAGELALPLESAMAGGGDARLLVAPATGLNRYGTTPRPRPEAIHFSSSTASSVSDYGFALCGLLRRRMLRAVLRGAVGPGEVRGAMADAVREEIGAWLRLEPGEADVVLAPSGTDTELVAVLLALAAGGSLTNVLIAPEETGRGVVLAGGGSFFDDTAAAGLPVRKGAAAWPDRTVRVSSVTIRDGEGRARPPAAVAADTRAAVAEALARGDRVLLHVLLGSKTGLSAPALELAAELEREAGGRLDVVVDACQLRVTPAILGGLVRRGWLVQVSGSKFLTGPPFSGALVIPGSMRARAGAARLLQATAPAVSRPSEWPAGWRDISPGPPRSRPSPGPLLRWAAALGEAALLRAVPVELSRHAFASFGAALRARLARSAVLVPLDPADEHLADLGDEPPGLAANSIICFAILDPDDGRPLSLAECQHLFELLNRDVSGLLPGLGPADRALAAQPAHIGQPVELRPGASGAPSVLRLVVGARFFTIVGFAEEGATETALASEIADATRAIDKLELLVRHRNAPRQA